MGFIEGLTDILGGWNAARRIDTEGFDWREKAQQAELQRQQQAKQFEQANEDWATRAATQAALGADEGEDISGLIPQGVHQARVMARTRGGVAESRPALESMRLQNRLVERGMMGEQRLGEIGLRGEQARELESLRAKNRANMQLSPAEKAKLDAYERIAGQRIDAAEEARRSRLYPTDRYNPETGANERTFVDEETARRMARGEVPAIPRIGATEQNRRAAAHASIQRGESLLTDLKDPEFSARLGPVISRYNTLKNAVDAGDPYAQYLVGELRGWSALQPQIHGFRSAEFVRDIERLINTRQSPEALAATLEGLLAVSYTVRGQQQPRPGFLQKEDERKDLQGLAQELAGLSPAERQQLLGGR